MWGREFGSLQAFVMCTTQAIPEECEGMEMASNEGKTLDAVVRLLERRDGENRTDLQRPDLDPNDPRTVDLCVRLGSREYALEHTQIQPFRERVRSDAQFNELIESVESEVSGALPGSARYRLVLPTNTHLGVRGEKLNEKRRDLVAWVRENAQCLHDRATDDAPRGLSHHSLGDPTSGTPPGFPFEVTLLRWAHSSLSPCDYGVLKVARVPPENLEQLRYESLRRDLDRKCPKLQLCKEQGTRTVLVLEAEDILTGPHRVAEQLAPLLNDRTDSPDEVFVVVTLHDTWEVWPMKCDDQFWSAWICLPTGALVHIDDLTDLKKEYE